MSGVTPRIVQLDWSSISGTESNFFNAVCLLELLHKGLQETEIPPSQLDTAEDADVPENEESNESYESEISSNESSKQASFDDPNGPKISPPQRNVLRDKFLDRLAEVLARFKDAPKANNRQAYKHIASAYMEEQEEKSVTVIIAKNKGLDKVDQKYLEQLSQFLQDISQKGKNACQYSKLTRIYFLL
jgi:hypothetical protein